jgi:hypothetical protein
MGLLYERAAVDFWAGVDRNGDSAEAAAVRAREEDAGAQIAS